MERKAGLARPTPDSYRDCGPTDEGLDGYEKSKG